MRVNSFKTFRFAIVVSALLMLVVTDAFAARYTTKQRSEFQLLLGLGAGYGGDTVGRMKVAGEEVDSFVAGKGMFAYVGDYVNLGNSEWSLLGRGGYRKGNILTLSNGSSFSVWPADFGVSYAPEDYRLNFGLTRHFHPKYSKGLNERIVLSPAGLVAEVREEKWDNGNGFVFEYGYEIERDSSYIIFRYTNLEYEMNMTNRNAGYQYKDSIDASSFSIGLELGLY